MVAAETETLKTDIAAARDKTEGIEKFLKLCETYTDLTELTAEIARSFIEKIVVHEAVHAPGHKWKRNPSK
jgi:hypothetical protein